MVLVRFYRRMLRHPKARWVVLVGSIVYLISPIDLIPDFLPVIGLVDDGVVATLMITGLTDLVLERRRAARASKAAAKGDASPEPR